MEKSLSMLFLDFNNMNVLFSDNEKYKITSNIQISFEK